MRAVSSRASSSGSSMAVESAAAVAPASFLLTDALSPPSASLPLPSVRGRCAPRDAATVTRPARNQPWIPHGHGAITTDAAVTRTVLQVSRELRQGLEVGVPCGPRRPRAAPPVPLHRDAATASPS